MSSESRVTRTTPRLHAGEPLSKVAVSGVHRFANTLRQIADPQALLIMRELSLGVRRFQDIQAQTKISSHLLSSRLRRLQKDGIVERRVYSARPLRHEYYATPKGRELDEILFAAANWNVRWGNRIDEPSITVFDKVTGKRLGAARRRTRRDSKPRE